MAMKPKDFELIRKRLQEEIDALVEAHLENRIIDFEFNEFATLTDMHGKTLTFKYIIGM